MLPEIQSGAVGTAFSHVFIGGRHKHLTCWVLAQERITSGGAGPVVRGNVIATAFFGQQFLSTIADSKNPQYVIDKKEARPVLSRVLAVPHQVLYHPACICSPSHCTFFQPPH